MVGDFWQQKYRKEAAKSWDLFYKRNDTRFFRDRHWIGREFPEIFSAHSLLEVGCGVGNFILPLMQEASNLQHVWACDFSPRAIEHVQQDPRCQADRMSVFVADVSKDDGRLEALEQTFDIIAAIFVCSALPPERHRWVFQRISNLLNPGGMFIMRDYAAEDAAQRRFKSDRQLDERFFVRQDGTFSYFFTPQEIQEHAEAVGLHVVECDLVHGRTTNVKQDIDIERLFVQAKLTKLK